MRSWKNLVTVTITPVPKGVPRAAASNRYIENILGALRHGRSSSSSRSVIRATMRAAWVLYTIGEGAKREHNAAAIMRIRRAEVPRRAMVGGDDPASAAWRAARRRLDHEQIDLHGAVREEALNLRLLTPLRVPPPG